MCGTDGELIRENERHAFKRKQVWSQSRIVSVKSKVGERRRAEMV